MEKQERLRRWRLALGADQADGTDFTLDQQDAKLDQCITQLYNKSAGLGRSSPKIARWLKDIREFFPSSVVKVMQKDAIERYNLHELLLEPELLDNIEPDMDMVANLLLLKDAIPDRAKDSARQLVKQLVEALIQKLQMPTYAAITGSLNRAIRNNRPRHHEIDWHKTIKANLKHYQVEYQTIIPERKIGYGRKRSALKDIILCVDQSGSMASSVVYSGIFSAVMASLPAVSVKLICFDTSVVDLTDKLNEDPVDLLFGLQLGGGTDINRALAYTQPLIQRPEDTVFILISDLYEGGNEKEMLKRSFEIKESGVNMIALLALDDQGSPGYQHAIASKYAEMNIPSFACTPDLFPDLMAAALSKQDIHAWAAGHDIVMARAGH